MAANAGAQTPKNHRIAYALAPDAPDRALIGSLEIATPKLPIADHASVVNATPLSGDGWLALNGCCAASSVHRFERVAAGGTSIAEAEMFAIDWVQLRDGLLTSGEGSRPEDHFGFGAEVRAVANGTMATFATTCRSRSLERRLPESSGRKTSAATG